MKKNLIITVLVTALCINIAFNATLVLAQQFNLSEFSAAQQNQLLNWWSAEWAEFYGSNCSAQNTPNTCVIREETTNTIYVQNILIKGKGNEQVLITPSGMECLDENREPKLCQTPLP